MLSQVLEGQSNVPFKSTIHKPLKKKEHLSQEEVRGRLQAWYYLRVFRDIKSVSD